MVNLVLFYVWNGWKDYFRQASKSGKLHSHSWIWRRRKPGGNEERISKCVEQDVVLFIPIKDSYYGVEMLHL